MKYDCSKLFVEGSDSPFLPIGFSLVDKILNKITTEDERQKWLEEQKTNCFDEYTWLQEYCCEAIDEASAFLPYELIATCETKIF